MKLIETACRCAKCQAQINKMYMNGNTCLWCKRKESEDRVRAALHQDARTHVGRLAR